MLLLDRTKNEIFFNNFQFFRKIMPKCEHGYWKAQREAMQERRKKNIEKLYDSLMPGQQLLTCSYCNAVCVVPISQMSVQHVQYSSFGFCGPPGTKQNHPGAIRVTMV